MAYFRGAPLGMQMLSLLILGWGCTVCENGGSLKAVHLTPRKQEVKSFALKDKGVKSRTRATTRGNRKLKRNLCTTTVDAVACGSPVLKIRMSSDGN